MDRGGERDLTFSSPACNLFQMKTLALIGMLSVTVGMASAESLAQFIKSVEGKYDKAIQTSDIAAFEKLMKENSTSDFVYIEKSMPASKPMNRDQMVDTMRKSFKAMGKVDKVESKTLSVKESGNTGVAVTTHAITNSMKGGAENKAHVMVYTGKSSDEYRRVNGKWKLAKMTWLETTMMMDGKPVGK